MSALSKQDCFVFAPQLRDAFNPCSRDQRKKRGRNVIETNNDEWAALTARRKRRAPCARGPDTTATVLDDHSGPQASDYARLDAELAAFHGEILFKKLLTMPIPQVEHVCQQRSWTMQDVIPLSEVLAREESSTVACATTLVRHVVCPHASELKTRRIFTSVVQIAERPLLEGLVIPLLPKLTKPDVQNLARIPFSPQNRISLLRTICADESLRPWQDPLLLLIEKTLSAQPLLLQPAQTFDLTTIVHQANMQILLVLTSKYGQSLVSQHLLDTVDATAQASQHVLKRAVMNHIASIRKRTIQNTK